jgi:hypothetical protein
VPDLGLSPLTIGEALELFLPAQRRGA